MNESRIGIFVSNQYFDFENIEEPVQTFMDNHVDFHTNDVIQIHSILNVRRHNYKLNDTLLGNKPPEEGLFYSVTTQKNVNYYAGSDNYIYFHADFMLDSRIDVYERTLKNSIDVLGDIGGIFEIIHIILIVPVSFIASRLLKKEICNKILLFEHFYAQKSKKSSEDAKDEGSFDSQQLIEKNERIKNYQEKDYISNEIVRRKTKGGGDLTLISKELDSSAFK